MPTTFASMQEAARTGVGGIAPRRLRAFEIGGKLGVVRFHVTLPASGLALGDILQLGRVPDGVAVLGGLLIWDRPQGVATTAVGIAGEPAKYGRGITDGGRFAETFATHGLVTTEEELVIATNAGAPWRPGSAVAGYVVFVGS